MNIEWNKVTEYSQLIAIVLFVGVFALGFWLGKTYEMHAFKNAMTAAIMPDHGTNATTTAEVPDDEKIIADVTYQCDAQKTIRSIVRSESVELLLSDGRHFALPQAISGSGVRYANKDESIVFWEKGVTAFMTEGASTTFADCNAMKPVGN